MSIFGNLFSRDQLPLHKKQIPILAPVNGRVKALDEFPALRFQQRLMGEGVAIEPSGYQIIAPFDCRVEMLNPTCEQIRLKNKMGVKLLIQLGLEAERMMAEGFKAKVKVGDIVKKGEVLLEFDLRKMKRTLDSVLFPVTILNNDKVKGVVPNYRQVMALEDEIFSLLI